MSDGVYPYLLAKLLIGNSTLSDRLKCLLGDLPIADQKAVWAEVIHCDPTKPFTAGGDNGNHTAANETPVFEFMGGVSGAALLAMQFTTVEWIVPGLLPPGLSILAGAPKVGKSWLALQIAQAVATGGVIFGQRVERAAVLYLALEDPKRRFQERMKLQGWPVDCDLTVYDASDFLLDFGGDLRKSADRLAGIIRQKGYRFVVLDTLSRAMTGDLNDMPTVTAGLSPLQVAAGDLEAAILAIHHHGKAANRENPDVGRDLLGSTALPAIADTLLGLYRERGKPGARLAMTGREVEDRTLNIYFDKPTECWQLDAGKAMPETRRKVYEALQELGQAGITAISEVVCLNKGNVYRELSNLEEEGCVERKGTEWIAVQQS